MPIYEYKCVQNGHQFEAFQGLKEEPLKACQVCNSPVEKLISSTSFQLKGGGWYVTDYKSSGTSSKESTNSEKKEPAAETPSVTPKPSDTDQS